MFTCWTTKVLAALRENLSSGFSIRSDTNRAVQPQKVVRDLKFRKKVEGVYYLCTENKGAAQLICAFVFAYAKSRISNDAAHFICLGLG